MSALDAVMAACSPAAALAWAWEVEAAEAPCVLGGLPPAPTMSGADSSCCSSDDESAVDDNASERDERPEGGRARAPPPPPLRAGAAAAAAAPNMFPALSVLPALRNGVPQYQGDVPCCYLKQERGRPMIVRLLAAATTPARLDAYSVQVLGKATQQPVGTLPAGALRRCTQRFRRQSDVVWRVDLKPLQLALDALGCVRVRCHVCVWWW